MIVNLWETAQKEVSEFIYDRPIYHLILVKYM